MKNSDYLKSKKSVFIAMKDNGIDVNRLEQSELKKLIIQDFERKRRTRNVRIAVTAVGLCFGVLL